jgi:hypothetical protein
MRPNSIKGKFMRKKILQLLLPGVGAALVATGCANSRSDACGTHHANYNKPPAAVREPGIPEYPCGEVLVREPALEPCRVLVNEGDPEHEHYWVYGYWAPGWVYIPAHEEPSPGTQRPVLSDTNSLTALTPAGAIRL